MRSCEATCAKEFLRGAFYSEEDDEQSLDTFPSSTIYCGHDYRVVYNFYFIFANNLAFFSIFDIWYLTMILEYLIQQEMMQEISDCSKFYQIYQITNKYTYI